MALRCLACGRVSPNRSQRCECGFDFATHEMGPVTSQIVLRRKEATARIVRGSLILAGVPVVDALALFVAFTLGTGVPIIVAAIASIVGVIGGVGTIVDGVRAKNQLPETVPRRQLPIARLVR
jgi:hypothetical protein